LRATYPKKHCLGPQNGPGSSGLEKTAKNSKLPKLPKTCFGPVGEGGWPLISTWINGSMKCGERCENVHLQIGDYHLKSHMFAIDMGGCDIMLGAEWLRTLGPILMDF
jgi:hypothetical protein